MPDSIEIRIGGVILPEWESYSLTSDLYMAADAFQIDLIPSEKTRVVKANEEVKVTVNGELELTGLIDKPRRRWDASGSSLSVTGRDIMGLVVDSYCERFLTIRNTSVRAVAERILRDIPIVSRQSIEYDPLADRLDRTLPYVQVEPGQKAFDVLQAVCRSRGLLFYARANGTIVFRRPQGRGFTPFSLIKRNNVNLSAILSGEDEEDSSQRYSHYTVLGQAQGSDGDLSPDDINSRATVEDTEFPKPSTHRGAFRKPYVEVVMEDKETPSKRARHLKEQRRFAGRSLTYTVEGHSQGTQNWAIDELVNVDDEELDRRATMLVYSRTFTGQPESFETQLRVGPPGVIA